MSEEASKQEQGNSSGAGGNHSHKKKANRISHRTQPRRPDGNTTKGGDMSKFKETSDQLDHKTAAATLPSLETQQISTNGLSTGHAYCLICYSDDMPLHRVITPCGHDDICAQCHLRLRSLHSDRRCPVCKAINEKLVVDADDTTISAPDPDQMVINTSAVIHHKIYLQYNIWGDDLGPNFVFKEGVGMFFPIAYYKTKVVPLFSYRCNVKGCDYLRDGSNEVVSAFEGAGNKTGPNADDRIAKAAQEGRRGGGKPMNTGSTSLNPLRALQDHLREKHSLTLCNLCVENKMDFVSRLRRFTPSSLKEHESKGDPPSFKGHPLCQFCRPTRFYDLTKLHEHLNKEHYKCHVCEKMGKHNQFFKNYEKLEAHFDKEHFLCRNPSCLIARFVVFENEIDLRGHEVTVHGGPRGASGFSTKIQLEFRIRRTGEDDNHQNQNIPSHEDFRFGLDGEVFVPEALPSQQAQQNSQQENEPNITYGPHAARTAQLRAEAERLRQRCHIDSLVEDFPSLGLTDVNGSASFIGWSSEGPAAMVRTNPVDLNELNFPSLASNASSNYSAMQSSKKIHSHKGTTSKYTAFSVSANSSARQSLSTVIGSSSVRNGTSVHSALDEYPVLGNSLPAKPLSNSTGLKQSSAFALRSDDFPALDGSKRSPGIKAATVSKYTAAEDYVKNRSISIPRRKEETAMPVSNSSSPLKDVNVWKEISSDKGLKMSGPPTASLQNDSSLRCPVPTSTMSLEAGVSQVENMKACLGPKYKQLKSLTRDFASNIIDAEIYIDQSLTLFDRGIKDELFWAFIPSLIGSCPNGESSMKAQRYLDSLLQG